MKKISVIIPIYNMQDYLGNCIKSVIKQTMGRGSLEIVLVNDGSTDNSLEVMKKYQRKYSNIVIVDNKHQGSGVARNMGTMNATGEYIFYLDADDYLTPEALETMYAVTEKGTVDIVIGKMKYFELNGSTRIALDNLVINDKEINIDIKNNRWCWDVFRYAQLTNRLYRRDFIMENAIKCSEGCYFEDVLFNLIANLLAKKAKVINLVTYNYIKRKNSTMSDDISKNSFLDIFKVFSECYQDMKRRNLSDYRYIFDYLVLNNHLPYRKRLAEFYDKSCIEKYSLTAVEYEFVSKVITDIIKNASLETFSLLDDEKRNLYFSIYNRRESF